MVMTIFAIIEPLRRRGLATNQVLSLFVYTLPVMVSLTMPIAALFAATIVYGRFSQDNELLASKASGIATISLLKPALALGALVTIVSLSMNYYVTPKMAELGGKAIKAGIRGFIYNEFKSNGYISLGNKYLFHADDVIEDADTLIGVAVVDISKLRAAGGADDIANRNLVRTAVASEAKLDFKDDGGDIFITAEFKNPGGDWAGFESAGYGGSLKLPFPEALPNPIKEKPSWYGWRKLHQALANPAESEVIRVEFDKIRRRISYAWLADEIASTINSGQPYKKLGSSDKSCEISAGSASVLDGGAVRLKAGASERVVVRVLSDRGGRTLSGDRAVIRSSWEPLEKVSFVTIERHGAVRVEVDPSGDSDAGESSAEAPRKDTDKIGELDIPAHIVQRAENTDYMAIATNVEELTTDRQVLDNIKELKNYAIPKIRGQVLAEIHGRFAYGLSCFLLVSMGAGLGLWFRGGQIMSAFALTAVPATLVIVMILMGKEVVSNPDAPKLMGLLGIWSGVAMLLVADVLLYLRLMRK